MTIEIDAIQTQQRIATPILINNAGIVLVQGFIRALFLRLGLVENDRFITDDAQRRAVYYLQFLITGGGETPENYLALNKLLCGLEVHEPIQLGFDMSNAEIEICQSLLNAMISHWSAIGSSSIDGFRGNWLVRDGSLTEASVHWDLIVERHAYDVLLASAPFSYSVIKLSWMKKPVYVNWPT